MSVAVVTAWHNHRELLGDYRAAVEMGPMPDELLVVDNGSDPPLSFAAIRNDENAGFTRANNQGLDAATCETVVFLNNDIAATQHGWLEELVDAVEPGVLVGHRLRSDQHTIVDGHVYPYLDGWCLAGLRDELLDLGGFDETLAEPAYYSDNLLCLEARDAGMTLREVPVGLIHKGGITSEMPGNKHVEIVTLGNRRRYQQRVRALAAERSTT